MWWTEEAYDPFFAPGENGKATEASYKVSLLITKAGKPHSIEDNLVKPDAKMMANALFGGKAINKMKRIPLFNDTIQWCIKSMAECLKDQLVTPLPQSQFFSQQLDESTDMGNEENLLCFVWYSYDGVQDDSLLSAQFLPLRWQKKTTMTEYRDWHW